MFRVTLIIILCFKVLGATAQGQVEVRAYTDTSYYVFGDRIHLSLEVNPVYPGVRLQDGIDLIDSVNIKETGEQLGSLEVLERGEWLFNQGMGTTEIVLGAFDTGYQFYVCPILYSQGQETDTVFSEAAFFYIAPVPTDSTGIAPIKDIIEEPLKLEDFLLYFLITGGLILLGGLIWVYMRSRKRGKIAKEAPPVYIPPHEIALDKLEVLKRESLWQQGKVKAYQSQLTYIIREYIEAALHVPALEYTSSEIITSLRTRAMDEMRLKQLSYMLNIADIVKFAKGNPDVNVHVELMDLAEEFVISTHQSLKIQEEEE